MVPRSGPRQPTGDEHTHVLDRFRLATNQSIEPVGDARATLVTDHLPAGGEVSLILESRSAAGPARQSGAVPRGIRHAQAVGNGRVVGLIAAADAGTRGATPRPGADTASLMRPRVRGVLAFVGFPLPDHVPIDPCRSALF
jgi:hypothetical protein